MTEATPPPSRTILVAVDFSETSEQAIAAAIELAAVGTPAELHLVTVRENSVQAMGFAVLPEPGTMDESLARLRTLTANALDAARKRHGKANVSVATVHGALGNPAHEIVHLAAAVGADLVVVGSHSLHGLDRLLLGSVAEAVVRSCGCPVLVIRPKLHAVARPTATSAGASVGAANVGASDAGPVVEPPCTECVTRRVETKGKELWCARHAEHHPRAHVFHYEGKSVDAARPWGFGAPE